MSKEREAQPQPERPTPLEVRFEHIPDALQQYPQWVVWKYARVDGDVKKPPYSPRTGRLASVRDFSTWGSFQEARSAYETGEFAGVGIVLTQPLGIVGIDIDHCIADGHIDRNAQQLIHALSTYTEVSPSGTGIRMMLEGKLPAGVRRRGNLEMYDDLRYVTLTGHHLEQTPQDVQPRHRELYGVYRAVFGFERTPKPKKEAGDVVGIYTSPTETPAQVDQHTLQTILRKALGAKNGEHFRRYYYGDTSLWEGEGATHDSQSEADFTLVLMLLYWTNDNASQVDALFRQSGLLRSKWDRPTKGKETYGQGIIRDAVEKRKRRLFPRQ
jgi:putative DNA primase/helicase